MPLCKHTAVPVSIERAGREVNCLGLLGAPGQSLGTQSFWACCVISALFFILCSCAQTHTDAEEQLAWPRETQELTAVNRTTATDSGGPAHLQANPETHQNMPSHTDEMGVAEQRFRGWGTSSPYQSSLPWALPAHRDSLSPCLKACPCKGHTAGRTVPAPSLV